MLSQQQAKTLAHFISLIRPDWNDQGIYAALGRCKDREPFAVALASIRAARDPGAKTPGVIPTDGPHWRELPGTAENPLVRKSYDVPCTIHPDQVLPCRHCAHDRVPADDNPAVALAKANLQSAKANLCSHGVRLTNCREDHDKPPAEPTTETEPVEENADA